MVKNILGSARANLLRTAVLCAVAPILGAVAVRALPEIPDLSGYQGYKTYDPIVMADLRYIVWRGSGVKDCAALSLYRDLRDQNPDRQLMAKAIAAFGEPECGQSNMLALKQAAEYARSVGRKPEADIFDQLAQKTFKPQFGKTDIAAELKVPAKAKAMVLGETTIVLKPGMRVGTQVERVARDWASYEMRWDLSRKLIPATLIGYHEGAFVHKIAEFANIEITPLAGTLIAKKGEQWYGPDEKGIFRFEVLPDKVTYPTTHVAGDMGWIEDTHGISAVVSQALEFNSQVVVGCGDSEGKAEAAFYLAQKGLDVVMPGDRYINLLLGYKAKGVIIGTAPVKLVKGTGVIGHQPVKFMLNEPIAVEDTEQDYPLQYYDAPARYFRQLTKYLALNVRYVPVTAADQIQSILDLGTSAVAVRVATQNEDTSLREWLLKSPDHRAILFHSGLYPFAQKLFEDFPTQVTFGDLHPKFTE